MPSVFIASIVTETNTFSPLPTGMRAFEENVIRVDASRTREGMCAAALSVFREVAEAAGYDVRESISAFAQPAGRVVRSAYEALRGRMLADLATAGTVDVVLLLLHGAMVAEREDDCEGAILEAVRELVPNAVIGLELDPHCHLTERMVATADAITIFKEYPHTDVGECAAALFALCDAKRRGAVNPVPALVDVGMIGLYPTFDGPMREIVSELRACEKGGEVLSASIAHGFPWGDVEDVGTRVLVYASDRDAARRNALEIADRLYTRRAELTPVMPDFEESLDRAYRASGRCVIGEHCDNPGGGAPGDSVAFLRLMLDRRVEGAVFGGVCDPVAAQICAEAGVGASLTLRLGGKLGPTSGDPLDLTGEVAAVRADHDQDAFDTRDPLGLSVWLKVEGVDVLIASQRSQIYGRDAFEALGIDLSSKRLIVVKSSRHFEAGFASIADQLWSASGSGALTLDFAALPYSKRRSLFYPRVADPGPPRLLG